MQIESVDWRLPEWVRLNIADCVVEFGRLEQQLVEVASILNRTTEIPARVKIARNPATQNFDQIFSLLARLSDGDVSKIRKQFEALARTRNLMVHGSWMMANGEVPIVVWNKFWSDETTMTGNAFRKERFGRFLKFARSMVAQVIDLKELAETIVSSGLYEAELPRRA